MAYKIYICNLWPKLRIGKDIEFKDGVFGTDDTKLQQLIEANNAWGSSIHYQDSEEIMARAGRVDAEKKAADRAALIKQLLAEEDAEKKAKEKEDAAEKAKADAKAKADLERARIKAAGKTADKEAKPSGEQ